MELVARPAGRDGLQRGVRLGRVLSAMLEGWHLLSLDAPTVAVVWIVFAAAQFRVPPGRVTPFALFLAVWILYAADRLLDARPFGAAPLAGSVSADLEARHHFHDRHRAAFRLALGGAAAALLCLLPALPPHVLLPELLLAGLLALWLVWVHLPHRVRHRKPLPKEFAVGLFFAAAIFVPWLGATPRFRPAVLLGLLCFAGLCTLNCLFVYAWEHRSERSPAHPATRWCVRHLQALALLFLLATLFAGCFRSRFAPIPLACGLSTALLLLLHRSRQNLASLRLRALADLVLLTPVIFVSPHFWP